MVGDAGNCITLTLAGSWRSSLIEPPIDTRSRTYVRRPPTALTLLSKLRGCACSGCVQRGPRRNHELMAADCSWSF